MALFDDKKKKASTSAKSTAGTSTKKAAKKTEKKSAPRVKKEVKKHAKDQGAVLDVLQKPWLSEKAIMKMEKGVYVFSVTQRATARDVARAIELTFGVTPRKVNMAHLPAKVKSLRTKRGTGTRTRRHKAYVYLAEGDTINF